VRRIRVSTERFGERCARRAKIRECFQGATALCSQLQRDQDGVLIAVNTPFLNVSRRKTSGVDLEVGQRVSVGPGDLNVRMLLNYVAENLTHNLGSSPVDAAGDLNNPEWQGLLGARYSWGRASLYVQERYYSATKLSAILTPAQLDPALNRVDRRFYTDLTFNYGDPDQWEAFITVNNPFRPGSAAGIQQLLRVWHLGREYQHLLRHGGAPLHDGREVPLLARTRRPAAQRLPATSRISGGAIGQRPGCCPRLASPRRASAEAFPESESFEECFRGSAFRG
jgi:hypothetical protein